MLAAYLAIHPERRFSREKIAGLLWGDKDEARARHSLSQALSDLRRTFGDQLVLGDSQFVWSPSDAIGVDVARLSAIDPAYASRQELELFEALHQGEFLQGFDFAESDLSSWLGAERERLSRRLHDALARLAQIRLAAREYDPALATAQRILDLDPYDETAHRTIMRCHAGKGFPRRARDHYEALSRELEIELGVAPEEETAALLGQILNGEDISPISRTLADFTFVLEQLPYAVAVTDTENRIVGWNRIAEDSLGFAKDEMFGRPPTAVYADGGDLPLADRILRQAISGGRWVGDVLLTTKGGDTFAQRRIVSPLFGQDGTMVGAFGHGFTL
jgi:PAS domain S-box-containing protein